MSQSVRVRVKDQSTGHELTVSRRRLEATPEAFAEVEKPATGPDGRDLPPKYHRNLAPATPTGYTVLTVAALQSEIDTRNDGREVDLITPDGTKKADLIAALQADDTSKENS